MYPRTFRAKMLQRMLEPDRSVEELAQEVGVSVRTLYRWRDQAGGDRVCAMTRTSGRRPGDWSAEEKLAAVQETASLSEQELGEYLRRKGLHKVQLAQWRDAMLGGLSARPKQDAAAKRQIRELEKELRRKDKALAEAAALLVLKKNHPRLERPTCGLETSLGVVSLEPTGRSGRQLFGAP